MTSAKKKYKIQIGSEEMYIKDKTNRITLRLNENQFNFVKMNSDELGVSPSEFLRMVINASMASAVKLNQLNKNKEGEGRENDKANINHIIQ